MNSDVLIVDDAEGHLEFMKIVFDMVDPNLKIDISDSGEEALSKIRNISKRPRVVLLDLKMPGKGGLETLQEIKTCPELKKIPVCMFSNGDVLSDVEQCYENGANFYFKKPYGLDACTEFVEVFTKLWFEFAAIADTPAY